MKRNINLALCIVCILFSACDDFLDIKPKGVLLPELFEDYRRLMANRNMMTIDDSYTNYITDDIMLADQSVQFGRYIQATPIQRNLYSFVSGPILSKGETDSFWENAYKRMYTLNTIINNVENCPDGTSEQKEELVATAKFTRAYEYLTLVNAYANHYDASTANTDLGVPVVLSEDISKGYKRNSVAEVYRQILKDMEESESGLPEKAVSSFYPCKKSWNALMTRIYLYMGDYENSKTYASKVISDEPQLLNLTDFKIDYSKGPTDRLVNVITGESYPNIDEENPESILTKNGNMINFSRASYVSDDYLAMMDSDLPEGGIDQRRAFFLSTDTFKLYNQVYEFPGKTMWVAYCSFNAGLNYSETMLTLAECHARLGDGEAAYKLLDQFRNYRILNNKPLPRVSAQDALRIALDERRREFTTRGSIRLVDLKRLNREIAFRKDIIHSVPDEGTWTLPANDPRYILPLPPKVLSENPSIPQLER